MLEQGEVYCRCRVSTDYHRLLSTKRGIMSATSWFLQLGLLGQFSLAKEMCQESQEESRNPQDSRDQDDGED